MSRIIAASVMALTLGAGTIGAAGQVGDALKKTGEVTKDAVTERLLPLGGHVSPDQDNRQKPQRHPGKRTVLMKYRGERLQQLSCGDF